MKKFAFVILIVAFLFTACSVGGIGDSDLNLVLDSDFLDNIYAARSVSKGNANSPLLIELELKGDYSEKKSFKFINKEEAENQILILESIPLNQKFNIFAKCYIENELYWEGSALGYKCIGKEPVECNLVFQKLVNTDFALFEKSLTGNNYVHLYEKINSSAPVKKITIGEDSIDSFCFDKEGNIYVLSGLNLESTNDLFTVNSVDQLADFKPTVIFYDNDCLFFAEIKGTELKILSYSLTKNRVVKKIQYTVDSSYLNRIYNVSVKNNSLVIAGKRNLEGEKNPYNLVVLKTEYVSKAVNTDGWEEENLSDLESLNVLSVNSAESTYWVNDLLIQDDNLYLLICENNFDSLDSLHSTGELVKVDLKKFTVTGRLGSLKSSIDLSSGKVMVKEGGELLYSDASGTPYAAILKKGIVDLPQNNSQTEFYGPKKFIAVKPDRVVFADDGIAVFVDGDGFLKYRNVNRVISVDIASFNIQNIQAVTVPFYAESKEDLKPTDTGYIDEIVAAVYKKSGENYIPAENLTDYTVIIPNAD